MLPSSRDPALKKIKKALLSLSDKTHLQPLCEALVTAECELFATSSTAEAIRTLGYAVVSVESTTGFPEILGGRVKTLHPKIFGGILAQTDVPRDVLDLEQHQIQVFDLVVCNLYPFAEALGRIQQNSETLTFDHCASLVEKIDIGGVSLVRAAAKNFSRVCVLNCPTQYSTFIEKLVAGQIDLAYRGQLAVEAFVLTAAYDALIQNTLQQITSPEKQVVCLEFTKIQDLRYGENPHQKAFFTKLSGGTGASFLKKEQKASESDSADFCDLTLIKCLQGKELSYNNVLDIEHAVRVVNEFDMAAAVIVKHNVACGVACSEQNVLAAYNNAFACDQVSPFGGIVCVNRSVTLEFARTMAETFLEVIVAPNFDTDALEFLSKKKNLRLVVLNVTAPLVQSWTGVFVHGGALFQECDSKIWNEISWVNPPKEPKSLEGLLKFSFTCVKHLRSNAIALCIVSEAGGFQTVAVSGGFTNRVDAVAQALEKWEAWKVANRARADLSCVLASDAFFPFPDSIELLKNKGVVAIVQPGGSVQDNVVVASAKSCDIAMAFSGMRHFKH